MIDTIHDRLYAIFMEQLVRIWRGKSPSFKAESGGFSLEDKIDIHQKWKEYVEGVGGKMMETPQGCNILYEFDSKNGVLFVDPCESPKNFHTTNAVLPYILLPMEVAEKILALGLP